MPTKESPLMGNESNYAVCDDASDVTIYTRPEIGRCDRLIRTIPTEMTNNGMMPSDNIISILGRRGKP
eukprot:scaffold451500_cov13-Prasinocladus_malaysianus.AAC.1